MMTSIHTAPVAAPVTLDCGHLPTVTSGIGTGVAMDGNGASMCYGCADSRTAEQVAASKPGDRITLYVSSDGQNVTTWSGGVIMNRVQWLARHHWSRDRWYIRATDIDGRVWSGTGAEGMWADLKLTRGKV